MGGRRRGDRVASESVVELPGEGAESLTTRRDGLLGALRADMREGIDAYYRRLCEETYMTDRVMSTHDQRILHSSESPDWRTPRECFDALDREFVFEWDLAADATSTLCTAADSVWYLGPGSPHGEDALTVAWHKLLSPVGFLNPPFSRRLAAAYRTGRIKNEDHWVSHEQNPAKALWYEIDAWAEKCWTESQLGATIVGLFPFAPQTDWYRQYVYGHCIPEGAPVGREYAWSGHAAREERRLSHRISFLRPDGSTAANAGVNTAIVVWKPSPGIVGPWQPHSFYWSYR